MKNGTRLFVLVTAFALLFLGVGSTAKAATADASVVVSVAAAASISATPSATLSLTGSPFTGTYTGTTTLNFSIRTTQTTGSGSLTVLEKTEFSGALGGVGPLISNGDLKYSCNSGNLTGGGNLVGTLTYCGGSSQTVATGSTPVLTGIGAKSNANNATLAVAWSVADSATYNVDQYTAAVTFTLTAN